MRRNGYKYQKCPGYPEDFEIRTKNMIDKYHLILIDFRSM